MMLGSVETTLIVLNEEMNDIMRIVKSLKEYVLLINDISESIKNKTKTKKNDILRCY